MRDDKLSPGFLIAPPALADPNFHRAVVLLAAHDEDGSMGFVINRALDVSLCGLLSELEVPCVVDDRDVLLGGPVSGFSGFVLYEHDEDSPLFPGIPVTSTTSVSPSRALLEHAAQGALPGRFELLLGYAGWGPSQLDDELSQGAWLHAAYDDDIVWSVDIDKRWDEVHHRLGFSPLSVVDVPGGAQA